MGKLVSVALVVGCLTLSFAAPAESSRISQREVNDGIRELRRAIGDAAMFLSRSRQEDINDARLFFEGQRQRINGLAALARCVESVNDSAPASKEKALVAGALRSLISELNARAVSLNSLHEARDCAAALLASKSFEAFDRAQNRPQIGVDESIIP